MEASGVSEVAGASNSNNLFKKKKKKAAAPQAHKSTQNLSK